MIFCIKVQNLFGRKTAETFATLKVSAEYFSFAFPLLLFETAKKFA
jgi:hypothetical protein